MFEKAVKTTFTLCSLFITSQCLSSNFTAKTADLAVTYLAISTLEDQFAVVNSNLAQFHTACFALRKKSQCNSTVTNSLSRVLACKYIQNISSDYNCTDIIDILCLVEEIRMLRVIDVMASLWYIPPIDVDAPQNLINDPTRRHLCHWMEVTFQNWPFNWNFHC
eukprot:Em0002g595a